MLYREFAESCEKISGITKRLEIRALVADLLRSTPPEELVPVLYLLQGQVRPEYEGIELGVGEALAAKSLALVSGVPELEVLRHAKTSGDLGTTAEELLNSRKTEGSSPALTLQEVYDTFLSVTSVTGVGSQDRKSTTIAGLLHRATPLEAKHIARFLLGKLRLGVKEMTLLDALAVLYGGDEVKAAKAQIETAFSVTSDLGEVATVLAREGLPGLSQTRVTLGKPVRAMLAEREATLKEVLERMEGRASLEYKYDGLRLQAHVPAQGTPQLFSRRLENLSTQFPEILEAVRSGFREAPVIVDGECVPFDPATGDLRPFQEVSRRRGRKYDLEKAVEEIPVKLVLFDLLLLGDRPCLTIPYSERRRMLEEVTKKSDRIQLATRQVVDNVHDAELFFQEALTDGCEGIVAKSVADGSVYKPGGRGFWWIKYKREYTEELADTVDAVIVGAYQGRGKRTGWYGAFLTAVYDPESESFPTLCKVGTGFDEPTLDLLTKALQPTIAPERPEGVRSTLEPDVWVTPSIVLELTGAELSLSPIHFAARDQIRKDMGLALRFPRFTGRRREDKGPEDCTSVKEIVEMYGSQVRKESALGDTLGPGDDAA